jgi:NADPH:quinone reductase-like Zn-dependent oxidoreductase
LFFLNQEDPLMSYHIADINKLSAEKLDRLFQQLRADKSGIRGARGGARGVQHLFQSAEHGNLCLEVVKPGVIDSLQCRLCPRTTPRAGEVTIEVYAAGLNFRDVMIALGLYPTSQSIPSMIGNEISGKVVAVGEGVRDFQIGDEVLAIGMGAFQSFVTTSVDGVILKPSSLPFETAAGFPVVFLTSFYALHHAARLSKGERILIHSAAGGVGLAAIQIAQSIGAEIFVTVGTPQKRDFMRNLGIRHVMDSRSMGFAEEVMKLTGNEGVDVVLNSLAGEAISKGLEILRPYGRFVELGKRDIMDNRQIGLQPFSKSISFTSVDFSWLSSLRPGFLKSMFQQIMELYGTGVFKPLPTQFFPISEAAKAFSLMARGTHIGKIVFLVNGQDIFVEEAPANVTNPAERSY